ncbi:MAG: hypothetical protein HY526_13795 [Betaproteobacteria bacterium]|nr:hypothetical protein [Betaproteobacteria bacterium]
MVTGREKHPLSAEELRAIDACRAAANDLSVGQIHLLDKPLLKEPVKTAQCIARRFSTHQENTRRKIAARRWSYPCCSRR